MKKSSRLIFFLIINILISAAATLAVLLLWERAHPNPDIIQSAATQSPENASYSGSNPTHSDSSNESEDSIELVNENFQIIIRTVVGAGNLESEYVEIFNQTEGVVNLTGWQLLDETENRFTFPALILNNSGTVKVFSKSGDDTVIELYWQADAPIWQPGETVTLLDADGNTITTYSIP